MSGLDQCSGVTRGVSHVIKVAVDQVVGFSPKNFQLILRGAAKDSRLRGLSARDDLHQRGGPENRGFFVLRHARTCRT
ncbi:hypothetical protein D3C86_2153770 [compost metagenome]